MEHFLFGRVLQSSHHTEYKSSVRKREWERQVVRLNELNEAKLITREVHVRGRALFPEPLQVILFPKAGRNIHSLFLLLSHTHRKPHTLYFRVSTSLSGAFIWLCKAFYPYTTHFGYLLPRCVCGCWWWTPGPLMKPKGGPPQPTWPWQAGLPPSALGAFQSSTNMMLNKTIKNAFGNIKKTKHIINWKNTMLEIW